MFSYLHAVVAPTGVYAATADFRASSSLTDRITTAASDFVRLLLTCGPPRHRNQTVLDTRAGVDWTGRGDRRVPTHRRSDRTQEAGMSGTYTFVLVHGGCHDGSTWRPVIEHLERLGHTAFAPTVAGHGKDVAKNVTHAESTQSVVDFILDRNLTDFILVGHGYAGTVISKVAEAIPQRVRRLVFWSAFVLNDGETALELLPFDTAPYTRMAAESADNTFTIPFDVFRDVFINDGDPDLVERAYSQLSCRDRGPGAATRRGGLASTHVKPTRNLPAGPDARQPRGAVHQADQCGRQAHRGGTRLTSAHRASTKYVAPQRHYRWPH